MKAKTLTALSLRGIPADWPPIEIGDKALVIYGPNGVGKSSIVDAIEFVLTGTPTLYAVPRQGVNWAAGGPHIGGGPMSAAITLELDGRNFEVIAGSEPPDAISSWCAHARGAGFVLRRHMLLRFINAEPRHRYDELEPFLNLKEFLRVEGALQSLASSTQTRLAEAETRVRNDEQALRSIFKLVPDRPINDKYLLDTLNAQLAELGLAPAGNLDELHGVSEAVDRELGGSAIDARLASLHSLKSSAQRLRVSSGLRPLIEGLEGALKELETEVAGREEAVLTEFLESARDIIRGNERSTCPACEQDIDRAAVLARLDERIAADERITRTKATVAERTEALSGPSSQLAISMKAFIDLWAAAIDEPLPASYNETQVFLDLVATSLKDPVSSATVADWLARLETTVSSHTEVTATIDATILAEGGGDRRQKLHEARQMISAVDAEWGQCNQHRLERLQARIRDTAIGQLHQHAIEARKATVQYLLDDVAGIANDFYKVLHPGEGLGNSRLSVRPTEYGSINLQAEFYGRERSPLLYYSESHLDTLGLCYFLALRRREANLFPDFKLLVLDDVVHSVDSPHRERLARLLSENFADHQIIITMHDRLFYERVRAVLGTSGVSYLSLLDWDIERGPIRGDASTDLDRICVPQVRETKSPEELAAAGGRFFEFLLRELTEALEVAIPARFKRRNDIGTMWPPTAKKLRKNKEFQARHPGLVEQLDANKWVRNEIGAHHNEAEAPVDPSETRRYAELLAQLHGAVHCQGCRSLIEKHGDNDWRCRCGELRY
jgi:hypothetical protein